MKKSCDRDQTKYNSRQRLWLLILSRTGIAIGVVSLVGMAFCSWWLWNFINQQLAPLVEKNLTQTLKRPVSLGKVENFSLLGLQFGASSIPATTTDSDRISVTGVEVTFDPLQLLFNRTLKLDVTLVNPNVYIEQDQQGNWISTTIGSQEGSGPLKTELNKIRVRNADVVLVPNINRDHSSGVKDQNLAGFHPTRNKSRVAFAQVNGFGQFLENNALIRYELNGNSVTGGTLDLTGESRFKTQASNLQIQAQNLLASDITRVVELPLELRSGRVDGNLNIQLRQNLAPVLLGTANLKAVTAAFAQVPQPFFNSHGILSFQGTQIRLDNVQTSYGKIPGIASGVVDTTSGYNIAARIPAVSVPNAQKTLNLQFPVPVAGEVKADVQLTGPILTPILSGSVVNTKPGRIDRVSFSNVRTQFTYSTADAVVRFKDIQATPTVGGEITGGGTINLEQPKLAFDGVARNIPGDAIARVYGASPQVKIGTIHAKVNISGSPDLPKTVVNWQATGATYPASGQVIVTDPKTWLFRNTVFKVANGTVRGTGQLINNRWQATLQATNVQLGQLTQVPPALQAPLSGTFNLSGTTASFQPQTIRATGLGRLNVAGGTVTATNIQLNQGKWQTQLQANNVQLKQILPEIPPQYQGLLSGRFNLSGTTASFQPQTIRATGLGRLNVAGGTVTATNIQLNQGKWQALVNASQVELARLSEQLRGQLDSQLVVTGTVDSFSLADVQATGGVRFSQGLGLIAQPLSADVSWDGEKVIVQQATAPGLSANGVIFAKVADVAAPEITELNLNVQAQNYNLQDLPLQLPDAVKLAGAADFTGKVSGTLTAPNVLGTLQLQDLVVNKLAFASVLTGDVQLVSGQGLQLDVSGLQDRIAVNLDPNNRPNSFLVRRDQALATGKSQGENLVVNVENFPIAALQLTAPIPALGSGVVAGSLTGDFTINPATFAVSGDVAIALPEIGRIKGDQLVAQFSYANGAGTITNGEFIQGESRYALSGKFTQTPTGPEFDAQVNIAQVQVQNVLTALQFFNIQDFQRGLQPPTYARASALNTTPVGLANAPLLAQLRRYSEITALLQQQRQQRQQNSPLPELADLQGVFSGAIAVKGSLQTGISANFDLQGENWEWGSYNAKQVIAAGSFENGVLTLLPLRLQSDDTLLAFRGQLGGTEQSGQLQLQNFPVDLINNVVTLPVDVTGRLNGTATLAGSLENPQAIGELQLSAGTLNQKPVQSATASFSYANARFNFGSNVVVSEPEPVTINGSIPLQLPFASVTSDSNQISLDLNVQNEGLALFNLLTNTFAWQDGQGQVNLQVRGTTQQPIATGIATVNNAMITSDTLPEPLTDVKGTVRFNLDRILVENLQGKFSRGNVVAQGLIPIFASLEPNDPDIANPLRLSLNRLVLNLKGLYRGGASGNVLVTGTALKPRIGGEVQLTQGEISLLDSENAATPLNSTNNAANSLRPLATSNTQNGDDVLEFNNLQLTLGNAIEITRPPILNFQATGTLALNGSLNDLRPNGTIKLRSGGVNLFTTQFVLARGEQNTATFSPNQALDPNLDIRLVARVPEITRRRVPTSPLSGDITETLSTDLGGFETVRVQATVKGAASQIFDNLELTSTPSRTQSEIIALIGGGFVDTLGRGDSALGLANLAGSALLGNFQGTVTNIGNAFGLSELRVFPTLSSSEGRSRSSILDLAAEAGVDISRNLSVSALRVLTSDEPTRFGLTYRLNEQVRLRAGTDFSGDSRAMVEYENRF